jgi:hypothetical protein
MTNHAAVQFHPAVAPHYPKFIRWEIIACNVIYLALIPNQSTQPAARANVLKGC